MYVSFVGWGNWMVNFRTLEMMFRLSGKFSNLFHIALCLKFGSFPITAISRNGDTVEILSWAHLYALSYDFSYEIDSERNLASFQVSGRNVILTDAINNGDIAEIFGANPFRILNPKGKTVIDIGANIGDSSIYFAINGATKVFAVEPFPRSYSSLVKNINLNELREVVVPINAAIKSKKGEITLPLENGDIGSKAVYNPSYTGTTVQIPTITLDEIFDNVKSVDIILKMDCEGCEYEVIPNMNEYLFDKISAICLEYHKDYSYLAQFIRGKGYHVNVRRYRKDNGYIYAFKNGHK